MTYTHSAVHDLAAENLAAQNLTAHDLTAHNHAHYRLHVKEMHTPHIPPLQPAMRNQTPQQRDPPQNRRFRILCRTFRAPSPNPTPPILMHSDPGTESHGVHKSWRTSRPTDQSRYSGTDSPFTLTRPVSSGPACSRLAEPGAVASCEAL
jgi:hypothetical protein